jgi:hypothetical protein
MNNVTSLPTNEQIPIAVRDAILWQKQRVWYLRSLIECVMIAGPTGVSCEASDVAGALAGLMDYADEIHSGLDEEALIKAAADSRRRVTHDSDGDAS